MNYTAVVIEDNPVDAEVLHDYLHKYFPEIQIAATGQTVSSIKPLIEEHRPQIVFMDIDLPDGRSLEILDCLHTEAFQLIFLTSYNIFAIDAIRANAVDYIVKPVDAVLLKKAVLKALQRIQQSAESKADVATASRKISVPVANGIVFIDSAKIIRAEADGSYTLLITTDAKPMLVSKPLVHFERELPKEDFMRVHDSFVVNRHFVASYVKGKTGSVVMTDGFICNLSAGKKQPFLDWMNRP
ncbi:MAG: response regulator transcription factor [Chitinophagales bacterium]|nr:response regulator transcription factor [Chitinophagales bacterium]